MRGEDQGSYDFEGHVGGWVARSHGYSYLDAESPGLTRQ